MSVVCCLEFSSLMACEKELSRILLVLVLMLWYRLPDGSSEKSSWLGWQESLMIFRAFLTSLGVDVLEGGKLTSDDVLGHLNYSMHCFPVESGAVPVPGSDAASQDALHKKRCCWAFLTTDRV